MTHRNEKKYKSPRLRGQAAIIIALSMLLLIAAIGLAVDGGAMYVARRGAQNSADAAALAATRTMLSAYETMIVNTDADVDGTQQDDTDINTMLTTFAAAHGIARSDLEAYYVDDNKQYVSATQVGSLQSVPWTLGAKGISVKNRASTPSFFMSIFGWNTVGASAQSLAFMGISSESSDISVLPIGLYTSTVNIDDIHFGDMYTLLDGDVTQGSGNWGWVDFSGRGTSANVSRAWLSCGFNPAVTSANWPTWCPDYSQAQGYGPTQHYESANTDTFDPSNDPTYVPFLVYGEASAGWWVAGSSGSVASNCHDFRDTVRTINNGNGAHYLFPIFDKVVSGGGGDTMFHLRIIGDFWLTQNDVSCHPQPDPNHEGKPDKWFVQGVAKNFYDGTSSGKHGDLRHTSGHVVFLDN